jgi:hypothetical protein
LAPRAPRRAGCAARKPVRVSCRTWCRVVAGSLPRAVAISLLVRASERHTRRMRSRSADARAFASASLASRRLCSTTRTITD